MNQRFIIFCTISSKVKIWNTFKRFKFQNDELSFSKRMQRFQYQLCKYIKEEQDEEAEGNLKDDSDMSSDEDIIYGRSKGMNNLQFMKHLKWLEKRSL